MFRNVIESEGLFLAKRRLPFLNHGNAIEKIKVSLDKLNEYTLCVCAMNVEIECEQFPQNKGGNPINAEE